MIKVQDGGSLLEQRIEELVKSIRNLKEEHDDLMIENKVLVCEKNKAESETDIWKNKCKELEIEILKLKKRLSAGVQSGPDSPEMYSGGGRNVAAGSAMPTETEIKATKDEEASGTRPVSTPAEQCGGFKRHLRYDLKSTVGKCLDFAGPLFSISDDSDEGLKTKSRKVAVLVFSSDSETNDNTPIAILKNKKLLKQSSDSSLKRRSANSSCSRDNPKKRCLRKLGDSEDKGDSKEYSSKSFGNQNNFRVSENSNDKLGEDEKEKDDSSSESDSLGVFIAGRTGSASNGRLESRNQLRHSSDSRLKRRPANSSCSRGNKRKRRLRKVGGREDKGDSNECSSKSTGNEKNFGISENLDDDLGEDEKEEDDSSSEGESLDGFIVGSSDASGIGSASNCSGKSAGGSENVSSDSMTYEEVISSFRRERKHKLKWDYEADMLADFDMRPEICMKAVCAIYRQQTAEEQSCKATLFNNGRGFSHAHSESGSTLAEFLTDGEPEGDVIKSVEELEEFNPEGVKQCRKMARYYSKQLFKIYENKEDRFFHP